MSLRVHINEDVVFRKVAGEHVLINLQTGNFYSLNPPGSLIWDLLHQGLDAEAVVRQLLDTYETTYEVAHADLRELLNELEQKGLVHIEAKE